jgi:hypothetical protein
MKKIKTIEEALLFITDCLELEKEETKIKFGELNGKYVYNGVVRKGKNPNDQNQIDFRKKIKLDYYFDLKVLDITVSCVTGDIIIVTESIKSFYVDRIQSYVNGFAKKLYDELGFTSELPSLTVSKDLTFNLNVKIAGLYKVSFSYDFLPLSNDFEGFNREFTKNILISLDETEKSKSVSQVVTKVTSAKPTKKYEPFDI